MITQSRTYTIKDRRDLVDTVLSTNTGHTKKIYAVYTIILVKHFNKLFNFKWTSEDYVRKCVQNYFTNSYEFIPIRFKNAKAAETYLKEKGLKLLYKNKEKTVYGEGKLWNRKN
jgi:hypothetical protein